MALTISPPLAERLALRMASRAPVFSGAAAVARVLAADSPHLTELLHSGSTRNLSEAFQQLNPSEQNVLRERWGRSLDELISLASERDATIFHHGLLEVGHRLEENDQLDLASVVYSTLVGNSPRPPLNLRGGEGSVSASSESSPPLNLRGGQEGLLPVLASAQSRLNAINGVGDWRARLAFNLERLPTNATRWDMLFAMGGAGLVFRGVRLAATARWASSFESAFALNAATVSSAFLAETAAFTGLGRLFGTMAGNHYDWSAEGTFNEWAGGAAMLLGLKAMGGVFGNLSERWAAGETAFARVTRAVAPQAGMFSGIVLGNRLAELGGFHPERHGDTWLTDGLTTLLEFNIAGRLQRSAGGPGLTNLEGRMEAYTRSMVSRSKDRLLPGDRLLRGVGEIFSPELVTPEGVRDANLVFSMGNKNDGPGPRGRLPSLLDLGGEVRRPRSAPPVFEQGRPYSLKEIPEGSYLLRVHETGEDLKAHLLATIGKSLHDFPENSMVFLYEGSRIGRVEQGALRVEAYRLLREKAPDTGRRYIILLPQLKTALVFRKQFGIVQVQSLALSPPTPSEARPSEPSLERISELPDRPSYLPEAPGEAPGYANFSQLKEAFGRLVLSPPDPGAPPLRLSHGVLGERELGHLTDLIGLAAMPDRTKWVIHWMERGGGSLSFKRQGDRIVATLRGSKTSRDLAARYFLFPHATVGNQLRVVPVWQVQEYEFLSPSAYRQSMQVQLEALIRGLGLEWNAVSDPRLEEGLWRGQILARAGTHLIKEYNRSGALPPALRPHLLQLHRLLEQAYTLLDFETVRRFRERMGGDALRYYDPLIDPLNRVLEREHSPLLVPLRSLNTEPEFEYAVPRLSRVREEFLHSLFANDEGRRSPWQNHLLFGDPLRLGQLLANLFQVRLGNAATRIHLLKARHPNFSLQKILDADARDLAPDSVTLRQEVRALVSEFAEFAEIFSTGPRTGRAGPHRRLLRAAFSEPGGIYRPYDLLYREISTFNGPQHMTSLLSPEQIQKYFELVK